MMMNNIKNELTEAEMDSVAAGARGADEFRYNQEDFRVWQSLSPTEQGQILALPDGASRRAKMFELWKKKGG